MEKISKKYLSVLLIMAIVLSLFYMRIPALAASTRKCYTIRTGNTQVYSNKSLTVKYGLIYDSDEITVLDVTSHYSKVNYPISGGRTKTGYIHTSAILTAVSGKSYKATNRITTYRRPNGVSYGYIDKNDTVLILGKYQNYIQVKYPVNGGYKYAFIAEDNHLGNEPDPHPSSGNQADALVQKAKSQIGVQERSVQSDNIFYNDWYYGRSVNNSQGFYPWCAVFVSWCADQTGILHNVIPKTASTNTMKNELLSLGGKQHLKGSGYIPAHGDIVFFGPSATTHVGIVDYTSGNIVYYIDGNNTSMTPHGVKYSNCRLDCSDLWGFVTPAYGK
ncbi:MAG: CHAP domain-containing protein [Lachnospiraceae bacterium]|nr:CHAP domain-containing protein [Lachnospiraceae bacterium]